MALSLWIGVRCIESLMGLVGIDVVQPPDIESVAVTWLVLLAICWTNLSFGRCRGSLNASVSKICIPLLGTVCCTCGLLALLLPEMDPGTLYWAPFMQHWHARQCPYSATMLVITGTYISYQ